MLISVALTLLVMFAIVRVFDLLGRSMREGRAAIEMAGQMRSVMHRLQQDLDSLTCPVRPWIDPESGLGYFELIEGVASDAAPILLPGDPVPKPYRLLLTDTQYRADAVRYSDVGDALGDVDDILMFTIRSQDEPFVGRIQGNLVLGPDGLTRVDPTAVDAAGNPLMSVIESRLAEVAWWVQYSDRNGNGIRDMTEPYMLYRRMLLVRPDLDLSRVVGNEQTFFLNNDVSARPSAAGGMIANSLSDLTKRENRFAHDRFNDAPDATNPAAMFPYRVNPVLMAIKEDPAQGGLFVGEDVILGDVLAFDARVYDPTAPIAEVPLSQTDTLAVSPGDPGFPQPPTNVLARGAFVDLNYGKDGSSVLNGIGRFSGPPDPKSGLLNLVLRNGSLVSIYDAWPSHYERDGINEVNGVARDSGLADEGVNGLDDDGVNGVDDALERETAAPYGFPLRGIEVRIRMMEFSTRQVRQISVVGDFVPE